MRSEPHALDGTCPHAGDGVDVVYFNIHSAWGEELRYSIRSLEENFTELGRVHIVGDVPPYIDERTVVHWRQTRFWAPQLLFTSAAIRRFNDEFAKEVCCYVFAEDDHYLLEPTGIGDLGPQSLGDLRDITSRGARPWQQMLWRTFDLLAFQGLPTVNYESHTPFLLNAASYGRVAHRFAGVEELARHSYHGICGRTMYFNSAGWTGPMPLAKENVVGLHDPSHAESVEQLVAKTDGKRFLFHDDAGLTPATKRFLAQRFTTPSRFEIR